MTVTKNDKNPRTTGRPTLNEVARLAGVSPITASRALRGVSTVAESLVEKVRQAARDLNYVVNPAARARSEEHTSELQSLMRISYAVFCLKKTKTHRITYHK